MIKYKRVYFRINTPSYYKRKYGIGFENQEAKDYFNSHATELFLSDGWEVKEKRTSGGCSEVIKDKQELYLHPQSFSGVVSEENIKYIEQLLSDSSLFKFEKTDIFKEVFDLSDDEYISLLKSKQVEIEREILENYKTKRRNLYITDIWTPLQKVLDNYRIERLDHYVGVYSSSDIDYQFILEIFEDLVKAKKIVTANCKSSPGYRTINKTEQKELKIVI